MATAEMTNGQNKVMDDPSLKRIPLSMIRKNPNALRQVDRNTEEYAELVDSVKKRGVYKPILVRECYDQVSGEQYYSLIDGLQRYSSSVDAGLENIPCNIVSMTDAEVLEAQIIANVQRIDTTPTQYAKQLIRILSLNPTLTLVELSGRLSKSVTWLKDRLSLNSLEDNIKTLIDEGKIPLANGYSIAKLPPEEQSNFIDRAMTMQPGEFLPTVNNRLKELREANRQGRAPTNEFKPVEVLRGKPEIRDEMNNVTHGQQLLAKYEITDPVEAWKMAVKWTLRLDPDSVQEQVQREEARKQKLADEREARKRERQRKEEEEAAKTASELGTSGALAKYFGIDPVQPVNPTGHQEAPKETANAS